MRNWGHRSGCEPVEETRLLLTVIWVVPLRLTGSVASKTAAVVRKVSHGSKLRPYPYTGLAHVWEVRNACKTRAPTACRRRVGA